MAEDEDDEELETVECDWCGQQVEERGDLDDNLKCQDCLDAEEDRRQLESDYRFWCR